MNSLVSRLIFSPMAMIGKHWFTQVIRERTQTTPTQCTYPLWKLPMNIIFIWPTKIDPEEEARLIILNNVDKLFENGRYEECYNELMLHKDDNDVEIKWRLSRVLYNMAKDDKYESSYKKELISRAFQIIAKEVDTNENNHDVHKWYALLLDAKSSNAGLKDKIMQLENVKKHMDLAVAIDQNDAATFHMLGEWCYQVSKIPWFQRKTVETLFGPLPHSNFKDALDYFMRAETLRPRFYSINLLRLGNCYLELKKEDQAKYYLQLAASYPAQSDDDHRANKEAMELLKTLT